jgi:hypothetical protein
LIFLRGTEPAGIRPKRVTVVVLPGQRPLETTLRKRLA